MKIVDEPFGAWQSHSHSSAGCVSVLHRQIDNRNAWPVVLERHSQSLPIGLLHDLQTHHAAAAVHDRVARQFARRGNDSREIEDGQPELTRPLAHAAPRRDDVDAGPQLETCLFGDDGYDAHARAAAARSTRAIPRSTSSAV